MESGRGDATALRAALGKQIEVKGLRDHSPKTKHGTHPVYELVRVIKVAGKPFKAAADAKPVQGVVAAIHYAKHGEPNGVMLESGEFIHTRPHGMRNETHRLESHRAG